MLQYIAAKYDEFSAVEKMWQTHSTCYISHLGCIWIKDFVMKKEMKMKKLDNPTDRDYWSINHVHCLFTRQILDPNTALKYEEIL